MSHPLNKRALEDYTEFRYALDALPDEDAAQLTEAYAAVSHRRWYIKAIKTAAFVEAYLAGRLDGNDFVAGADPDIADLRAIAGVAGGGAVDVAVAILVRDLIKPATYAKLTGWWAAGADAAWLPDDDDGGGEPEPPSAEPLPVAERADGTIVYATLTDQVDVPLDAAPDADATQVLPRVLQGETLPPRPVAGGPRPAQARTIHEPQPPRGQPTKKQVMNRAKPRLVARASRNARARNARIISLALIAAGVLLAFTAALTAGMATDRWGLYGGLAVLAIAIASFITSAVFARRATRIQKGLIR